MEQLILEAKDRIPEIARKTKECPEGHYTAIYKSDNGYTVSHIQKGWETRTPTLSFQYNLTKRQVKYILEEYQYYSKMKPQI